MADDYLYHYTDARAVMAILERRQLWASDSEYLNDGLEGRIVPKILKWMAETNIFGTERFPERYKESMSRHLRRGQVFYVASFSKRANMLTQFKMYCPPRGGFVIGFPSDYLSEIAEAIEVIYDRNVIERWCLDFFHRYMQRASELDDGSISIDDLSLMIDRSGPWLFERCRMGIACKSSEFSTEEEVRLLKYHCSATHFRSSPSGNVVIPYVELDMPNGPTYVHVAPGPGPSHQIAQASIGNLTGITRKSGTQWTIGTLGLGEFGYREL